MILDTSGSLESEPAVAMDEHDEPSREESSRRLDYGAIARYVECHFRLERHLATLEIFHFLIFRLFAHTTKANT